MYGHLIEGGEFSRRLESGRLSISKLVELAYAPDPLEAAERAEDEEKTVRQIREERREGPKNVETVELVVCPHCGAEYPLSHASTRTQERA